MNTFKALCITGLAAAMIFGCTNDFEEINKNPNTIVVGEVRASSMLEPLLYDGANAWLNQTWFWNDELIQFTAFTGGTTRQEHRYSIGDANWQSTWNLYARYANNTVHMYDLAVKQENTFLQALALTLKVLYLSNLTDIYGDIPYSEAFRIRDNSSDPTAAAPKFDSQKEVYEHMFADLETANTLYASNPVFLETVLDGMYGGSVKKWRKFNNTLYLRLLCRVSGRTEMNVGARMMVILNDTITHPIFQGNYDNATVKFTGNDPYRNQFAITPEGEFTTTGRKLTQQLIKMTVTTDGDGKQTYQDPRLPIIGKKNTGKDNPNGIWIGTVSGCTPEQQNTVDKGTAFLNFEVFCRPNAPGYFMDYSEVQFILAEAALKGYIGGGEAAAEDYYTKAITASMQKWAALGQYSKTPATITDADIATFLDSSLASWEAASNKEELIANQKFLSLFWIGMEAYHEYRRTGYPTLTIGPGTVFNNYTLPTRFAYPGTTMATNGKNAQEALNRMGGANTMTTPVWWSKQAIKGN